MHELCRARPGAGLPAVLELIGRTFADVEAASAAGGALPQPLARAADGALLVVGSLADVVKRKAPYRDQVEPLLARAVLPLFASTHGHLRAKACWCAAAYADARLEGGPGAGPTFDALFARVSACLADPDLPVRVDAAAALRGLVGALDEARVPSFQAALPPLLRQLLELMAQIDNEDLVGALEALVEKVGPGIAPYASDLTAQLVAAWDRLQGGGDAASEPSDDDAAMASYALLRTLLTILDAVAGVPGAVPALTPTLLPLLHTLLSPAGEDAFEEGLDILAYLTYCNPEASKRLGTWVGRAGRLGTRDRPARCKPRHAAQPTPFPPSLLRSRRSCGVCGPGRSPAITSLGGSTWTPCWRHWPTTSHVGPPCLSAARAARPAPTACPCPTPPTSRAWWPRP